MAPRWGKGPRLGPIATGTVSSSPWRQRRRCSVAGGQRNRRLFGSPAARGDSRKASASPSLLPIARCSALVDAGAGGQDTGPAPVILPCRALGKLQTTSKKVPKEPEDSENHQLLVCHLAWPCP
uniref:Uncharacterized protein n=1 Tax=Oryza barthii TaxID=65489 RepID=A0A0D3F0X5_9ORYZ